jgi:hypothetical protein
MIKDNRRRPLKRRQSRPVTKKQETGKVVKTLFLGDEKIIDSKVYLDNCIENYSRALNDIVGIRMIIKVWEMVKGKCSCLECEFNCQ